MIEKFLSVNSSNHETYTLALVSIDVFLEWHDEPEIRESCKVTCGAFCTSKLHENIQDGIDGQNIGF